VNNLTIRGHSRSLDRIWVPIRLPLKLWPYLVSFWDKARYWSRFLHIPFYIATAGGEWLRTFPWRFFTTKPDPWLVTLCKQILCLLTTRMQLRWTKMRSELHSVYYVMLAEKHTKNMTDLKQQALLANIRVTLFCNLVSRPSNLYKSLNVNSSLLWSWLCWSFFGFLSSPLCPVSTIQNVEATWSVTSHTSVLRYITSCTVAPALC